MLCAPWRPFNASATDVSLPNNHRKRPPAQRVRSSANTRCSGPSGGHAPIDAVQSTFGVSMAEAALDFLEVRGMPSAIWPEALPLCAEMCSMKALLAGGGEIIARIYKERVVQRGCGSGAWGCKAAYHETVAV